MQRPALDRDPVHQSPFTLMIIQSDNTATDMVFSRVGGPAHVNDLMRQMGFSTINATGDVGSFLSEYLAYHVAWYRDHTADHAADRRCLLAGHTHVGIDVDPGDGARAVALQLDEVIHVLQTPSSLA